MGIKKRYANNLYVDRLAASRSDISAHPYFATPVGASGGSAVADIRAAVGTSTNPTSTGTKAVTGVGFQPKVVMPFSATLNSDGAQNPATITFGAGTSSTSRASVGIFSNNALSTSATRRSHTDAAITEVPTTTSSYFISDLDSLDIDGFTLDWTSTPTPARILNHICLGGDDLEVSLTQHQMNGTNADESFAHGLTGGAPDALLFFSAVNNFAPPNTLATLSATLGLWAGSNQANASIYSLDAASTTETKRRLSNTGTLALLANTVPNLRREMAVDSVDSTNVNCTYVDTTATFDTYFFMLALRGCKAQVGTFDCNGSTDPLTISCTGITPKLFLPVVIRLGVTSINSVRDRVIFGIGASDGANTVSCGITDASGVSTTNTQRCQDSSGLSLIDYNNTNVRFDAGVNFSAQSVVLDPSVVYSDWEQGAYLIIGA